MDSQLSTTDMSKFVKLQNIDINIGFLQFWVHNFLFCEDIEIRISKISDYFEKGDMAFTEFSIVGLKKWKFGEIISQKEDGSWFVQLFGEHEDYIDKLRPTTANISRRFTISEKDFEDGQPFIYELYRFADDIKHIKRQPWAMKYYFYGDLEDCKLKWLVKQFWFYRIELPIRIWFESRGNYLLAKFLKIYLNLFYKKAIDRIDIVKMYDFCFPQVELKIKIKKDYIETIGQKLWKRFDSFRGFGSNLSIDICDYCKKNGKLGWNPVYWKNED